MPSNRPEPPLTAARAPRRKSPRLCGLWIALAWLLWGSTSHAEDTYEWKRTEKLLEKLDLQVAPLPQGKRIAWVRIVRDDIFVEDELWPLWFNVFHKTTRERVVRRELLFSEGEAYDDARIEETMRNLRSMGIFTLVRIVAVATDDPERVGIVVHTRDVWSLRLEQSVNVTRGSSFVQLTLIERNLAGINNDLGVDFTLVQDKYTLGQSYVARRFLGSDIRVAQYQGVIFGRILSGPEGSLGGLSVSEPFYRLSKRVSWSVGGGYDMRINRQLTSDGEYLPYESDGLTANSVYSSRSGSAQAVAAYRFGDEVKIALGGGVAYSERRFRPNAETDLPDAIADDFRRDILPLSRRDVGPRFYYDMFLARYRTLQNVGTYGQSENIRVGPRAYLGIYVPVDALGSTADAMVVSGELETVHTGGRGLFSINLQATARLQQGRVIDQRLLSQLRFATPTFDPIPVRLVSRLAADLRAHDSQQTFVSLGSDRGLRGYDARSFTGYGASRLLANVELRSLPLKLRSLHLGAVLFYDTGTLFANYSKETEWHHAVGVGIRFVFPQFNRYPFSLDVGFPVDPGVRLSADQITPVLNSAQSVPITATEEDTFP